MTDTSRRHWLLPDTVQPAEGSGLPMATTEVLPGRRYRFEVTGTVENDPYVSHVCSGANLAVVDGTGAIHYLNGNGKIAATVVVKGWPPRKGDVWKDERGQLWFVRRTMASFGVLEMVCSTGDGVNLPAHTEAALAMTLVYRPD